MSTSATATTTKRRTRPARLIPSPDEPATLTITVRLPEDDGTLDKLTALGLLSTNPADATLAGQVRLALAAYLERRLSDPSLPQQVADAERLHRARLAVLTDATTEPAPPTSAAPRERVTGRAVGLKTDQLTYDKLAGLAIVDDSPTVATQIRAAVSEYLDVRLADETLRARIAAAGQQRLQIFDTLLAAATC